MVDKLSIKNFRGIEALNELDVDQYNIFIGDNGTSKTSILDVINFAFSPNFLANKINHTDFFNGQDEPIEIKIKFNDTINAELPDGYTTQSIECDKLYLKVKKRDKKRAGKIFSDGFTLEHVLEPNFPKDDGKEGWSITRKRGTTFSFTSRSLALSNIKTEDLPRCFLFDKNRDRQLQKGYNSSFSNIIEDLNWRYLRKIRKETENGNTHEIFGKIQEVTDEIQKKAEINNNEIIEEFKEKTAKFDIDEMDLSIIDSIAPFEYSFLSSTKDNLALPIKNLGSGIEMIASLLFLETLASHAKEKLIILIDEPELHLHPRLQEKLAEYLWKLSQGDNAHQIFVTTHSPIFYKNSIGRTSVKTFITNKDEDDNIAINEMNYDSGLFPWSPTWGEINYFAYDYLTVEFHDELYGYIQERTGNYSEGNMDNFLATKGFDRIKTWTKERNGNPDRTTDRTLPVFIRNKVHHPENRTMIDSKYTIEELKTSTENLIQIVKEL